MNNYYGKIQLLPLSDKYGKITGKGKKKTLHRKGILHRGFSVALFYKGKIILQKRKHPAFDKTTDFTASGHLIWQNKKNQDEKEAVYCCLKREWKMSNKNVKELKKWTSFVYKAKDSKGFIEHEFCTIYRGNVDFIPCPNYDFAYGFDVVDFDFLKKNKKLFPLTPWLLAILPKLKL